jgi:kynurenine 3-monooxygenase
MLIALPNLDGSFTCTFYLCHLKVRILCFVRRQRGCSTIFWKELSRLYRSYSKFNRRFFKNPTSTLVTMKCYPWTHKDKIALVGDSSHAIVPFMGKVWILVLKIYRFLMKWWKNMVMIGRWFFWISKSRKPNADVAELSYRNFMEMSSKTADDKFLAKENWKMVFRQAPDKWIPLYSRVTFSDRPYAEA